MNILHILYINIPYKNNGAMSERGKPHVKTSPHCEFTHVFQPENNRNVNKNSNETSTIYKYNIFFTKKQEKNEKK
jgi:hypothetical protein